MRLLTEFLLLCTSVAAAATSNPVRSATIHAWPADASKPQTLAHITYETTNYTATVDKWTPPTVPADADELVRVGLWDSQQSQWKGVATSAAGFSDAYQKKLTLHLSPDNDVYHVGFNAFEKPITEKQRKELERLKRKEAKNPSKKPRKHDPPSEDRNILAEVIKASAAPVPHLNRPVVLDAEGKLPKQEQQQSFLQKYWWAIALFLVVQLVAGGASPSEEGATKK